MKVAGNIFMQSWIGQQLKEAYSGFFINPENLTGSLCEGVFSHKNNNSRTLFMSINEHNLALKFLTL